MLDRPFTGFPAMDPAPRGAQVYTDDGLDHPPLRRRPGIRSRLEHRLVHAVLRATAGLSRRDEVSGRSTSAPGSSSSRTRRRRARGSPGSMNRLDVAEPRLVRRWMDAVDRAHSTHEASLVPMHGWAMTYVTPLHLLHWAAPAAARKPGGRRRPSGRSRCTADAQPSRSSWSSGRTPEALVTRPT